MLTADEPIQLLCACSTEQESDLYLPELFSSEFYLKDQAALSLRHGSLGGEQGQKVSGDFLSSLWRAGNTHEVVAMLRCR